jgi:hypothetical protein
MEVFSRREEHDVRVELASEDFSKECPKGDFNTIRDRCYSGSGLSGATQEQHKLGADQGQHADNTGKTAFPGTRRHGR